MRLKMSVGSQAVLGLLLFARAAATLGRGTPDPTLGVPGRPAGRPGPQPVPGPVRLGDVPGFFRSMVAWGRGPDRGRAPGRGRLARARRRPASRGFRRQAGGAPLYTTDAAAAQRWLTYCGTMSLINKLNICTRS